MFTSPTPLPPVTDPVRLPQRAALYYGGGWHETIGGAIRDSVDPATGSSIASYAEATAADANAAIQAAAVGFQAWRRVPPLGRAGILRQMANIIRENAVDLARLDSQDGGAPLQEMYSDVMVAARFIDYFAGLVTEMKGTSIPMGPDAVNFSIREPYGVVARIVAFNHPFMFSAGKLAAPLAAGNAVIVKPPEQAPLSALRLAELVGHLVPAGALSVLTGGREVGEALSSHEGVSMVALVGSVPTGRAIMTNAARTLKPLQFELGGKNALIAFPDAEPEAVAAAAVTGMNYTWCGQSCGSVSRLFVHESIKDEVVQRMGSHLARYKPGIPLDPETTMGAIVNRRQYERVLSYIEAGKAEGATIAYGGKRPSDERLRDGCFLEPTIFTDVSQKMRIASEEIFGPVQSVIAWSDEKKMLEEVNSVEYGLTSAIFTNDLNKAHRTAAEVQVGYVWINKVATHFLGAPFGGYKQSGMGREECLEELISFTQQKNIHVSLKPEG